MHQVMCIKNIEIKATESQGEIEKQNFKPIIRNLNTPFQFLADRVDKI